MSDLHPKDYSDWYVGPGSFWKPWLSLPFLNQEIRATRDDVKANETAEAFRGK